MKKFYTLVCIGFFIYAPIALAYRLHEDFSHPEKWDGNPNTDPRLYLPVLGLTAAIIVTMMLRECYRSYRHELRRRELHSACQREVADKQREGKWEEAAETMRYYDVLLLRESIRHVANK